MLVCKFDSPSEFKNFSPHILPDLYQLSVVSVVICAEKSNEEGRNGILVLPILCRSGIRIDIMHHYMHVPN